MLKLLRICGYYWQKQLYSVYRVYYKMGKPLSGSLILYFKIQLIVVDNHAIAIEKVVAYIESTNYVIQ
jgi:hypothetical protein